MNLELLGKFKPGFCILLEPFRCSNERKVSWGFNTIKTALRGIMELRES